MSTTASMCYCYMQKPRRSRNFCILASRRTIHLSDSAAEPSSGASKKNGFGRRMVPSVASPIIVRTAQPLPCDKYLGRLSSDYVEPATNPRNGSTHLFDVRRDPLVKEVLHDRRQGRQGSASVDKNTESGRRLRTFSAILQQRKKIESSNLRAR